jgi:hypothetical protein
MSKITSMNEGGSEKICRCYECLRYIRCGRDLRVKMKLDLHVLAVG